MMRISAKTAALHGLAGPWAPMMPASWLSQSCSQTQLSEKEHYHIFPRGLNFQQNKLNHNIAEFKWGERVRREGDLSKNNRNVLASRVTGTPKNKYWCYVYVQSPEFCEGSKEKLWLLSSSRTTDSKRPSPPFPVFPKQC